MADSKKYYWLKLKKDFFSSKEMKKLRKIAGGDTYTIIYLKLQLLSLQDEGKLYFDGIEDTFAEELALILDEDTENVQATLIFLEKCGLVSVKSDCEILLTEVPYLIGSEGSSAERVRRFREKQSKKALQCNTAVTDCNADVTMCNTEIEKDKEKEIEKDILLSTDVDTSAHFDYQSVVNLFNSICVSLPKVQKLTDLRKQKIRKANKELNGDFESFFKRIENSDFLTGKNGNWNSCNFDWILNPQNFIKIIEGNYDEEKVANNPNEQNRLGDKSNNTSYDIDKFNKLDMLDMMAALKNEK